MKLRYQYRVYPSKSQQTKLAQLFGCCRVVWNDALAFVKQSEQFPKNSDLQKICITQAKRTEQRSWLKEVSNIPLQQSVADLGVQLISGFIPWFRSPITHTLHSLPSLRTKMTPVI